MQTSANAASVLFPDEIIVYILHFLAPCDVLRLRLVSKQFKGVTCDARLWRTFYTNSRLLRPPGPFLWQSTQFFERVLIHSARVSQTWTSQPIRVASRVQGPRLPIQPSPVSTSFDFLFGRLFIWCDGEQLLAQDLETGAGRLLWESTEPISSLSACSLTLPDGERVFVALRHVDVPVAQRTPMHVHFLLVPVFPDPNHIPIPSKLLEFSLQDDVRLMLGPVTFEMDLPEYANFPLSARAPFLYFDGGTERLFGNICERMVIDVRTRAIYKFPAFSSGIDAAIQWDPISRWCEYTIFSGSHIIVFHPCWYSPPTTLIQAFVAPDPLAHLSDGDIGQLRLTHEVLAGYPYRPIRCLRSAVIDPETGEVNIRFLSSNEHRGQTHFLCVDITIPPGGSASTEILPMFVNAQKLLVLSGDRRNVLFDTSDDGHGRGIITLSPSEPPESQVDLHPVVLYKFSIDASGELCTAMISEPSELSPQDVLRHVEYYKFDGIRGRICHDLETNYNYFDVVVLDLH